MTTFLPLCTAPGAGRAKPLGLLRRTLAMALPAALLIATGADAQIFSTRVTAESAISRGGSASAGSDASRAGDELNQPKPKPLYSRESSSASVVQYRLVDSLLNAFSYYSGSQEPFAYDPYTNRLVTIKRGPTGQSDELYVRYSDDLGLTWSAPMGPINDAALGLARYPSITIINPTNSTNPLNLRYYFTYPVTINDAFGTFYQGFLNERFQLLAPPDLSQGVNVNSNLIQWSSDSKSVVSADGNLVLTAGGMNENNIGLRRFDFSTGILESTIPTQWSAQNFIDPGSADSRTAVMIGMGRDNTGYHLAIYSRFPDREVSRRFSPYQAISSSTDNGQTWSSFDILPISVLEAYAGTQGAVPDSVLFPYALGSDPNLASQTHDVIFTGGGNASFVSNLFESNADKEADQIVQQLVEVYRENGQWGMRKIADLSGRTLLYDPVEAGDGRQNQMGNEAQISRTADGTGLIAKWTDLVTYIYDEEDINGDEVVPDTLTTTDVFVAVRKMGSSTWSAPLNVTGTEMLDRISWIPNIIPNDYNNIPLLTIQGARDENNDVTLQDQLVTGQLNVSDRVQYVMLSNFSAASIASVGGTVTARSGMALDPAFPNPATSEATINFNLKQGGKTSLEVWNVAGERISSLLDGTLEAGDHSVKVSAAGLPAGTYYYTLKSGGETLTRMFTVVR